MNDRENFNRWFTHLLLTATRSCFERDVLRANKENLWLSYEARAKQFDDAEKRFLDEVSK